MSGLRPDAIDLILERLNEARDEVTQLGQTVEDGSPRTQLARTRIARSVVLEVVDDAIRWVADNRAQLEKEVPRWELATTAWELAPTALPVAACGHVHRPCNCPEARCEIDNQPWPCEAMAAQLEGGAQ